MNTQQKDNNLNFFRSFIFAVLSCVRQRKQAFSAFASGKVGLILASFSVSFVVQTFLRLNKIRAYSALYSPCERFSHIAR